MTIRLELPPDVEARLHEEAARQGQDAAAYVEALVKRDLFMRNLDALKHRKPPQSLADLKPRIPTPPGKSWLEAVVGQWPGDESDEEIERILEEMS
jgi:hypothetical protein